MKQQLSGEELIEYFRTAMIVLSTAHFAKAEARRSEQDTLNSLDYLSRGTFLNPTNLPSNAQEQVARSSVDAHIKKVQASQIDQQSQVELSNLEQQASKYIGKKVRVAVLDRAAKPLESLWQDPTTGQYTPSSLNTKGISGKVEQILLEKNAIMLKVGAVSQLVSPQRHFFVAYVINPDNLDPFIELSF